MKKLIRWKTSNSRFFIPTYERKINFLFTLFVYHMLHILLEDTMFEKFRLKKARKGVSVIEYAMIASILCAAMCAVCRRVGLSFSDIFNFISSTIKD